MSSSESVELNPASPLVMVMAVACGVAVANIYYAQPLLALLSHAFGTSSGLISLIIMLTQLGYAAGLLFLVPLGDWLNRRRLVPIMCTATALALAAAAASPAFSWFVLASFFIGLSATCAQIMVPMAAQLAAPAQRGAVVGRVMSGLLIGILLARAFSGIVADIAGWRAVFGCAALTMLAQALVLYRWLPEARATAGNIGYRRTIASVATLLAEEPVLRRRIVYGALGFAGFTIVWTTLPFLLAAAPYHYSETVIGLFSLLGAAGALAASVAGRLHDSGHTHLATAGFLLAAILAFALMGFAPDRLTAIVAGLLLMDLGVQGVQILNQSTIYALRPDARSRITTAYMGCFFIAGALGSAIAGYTFELAGWPGTMAVAGALETAALVFWTTERRTARLARSES